MDEKRESIVVVQQRETEPSIGEETNPVEGQPGCTDLDQGRGRWATVAIQLCAALWLVPIVGLLYLNFTGHIIGASAWCPNGHCYLDAYNIPGLVLKTIQKFSNQDRELLGALQYVAKALEVWFSVVATSLVYLATMRIAGHKDGLPIGFLTRPFEYKEIISLIDPLLWLTGPVPWNRRNTSRERRLGGKVVALIALTVFLCALANLMGPATAVLVIPSLGWVTTKSIGNRIFSQLESNLPPQTSGWFWANTELYCREADFDALDYRCTLTQLGVTLDAWMMSSIAYDAFPTLGYTTQNELMFQFNVSGYLGEFVPADPTWWTPSRQMVDLLSYDQGMIELISLGFSESWIEKNTDPDWLETNPYSSFVEYNKSLDLTLERNGAMLGSYVHMWMPLPGTAGSWTIDVDAQRQVRCYADYRFFWYLPMVEDSGSFTKCIRLGSGWHPSSKEQSFNIQGIWDNETQTLGSGVNVTLQSSDRAAFFPNGALPSWLPTTCLTAGPLANDTDCDWERMFEIDPSSPLANRSENINTMTFHSLIEPAGLIEFVVDFNAFWSFETLSFVPSGLDNPAQIVLPQALPQAGISLAIDPAWILAAWSAKANGTLLPDRASTVTVLECMSLIAEYGTEGYLQLDGSPDMLTLQSMALVPIMQTLSIIDQTTNMTTDPSSVPDDPAHPLLQRRAQMYVWGYSLNSHTSILGAIVAILGCLVVVAEVVMGLQDKRRFRSPTQLLVAALEHAPAQEFRDRYEDKIMARTRFQVRDYDRSAGKFYFGPPQNDGGHVGDRG